MRRGTCWLVLTVGLTAVRIAGAAEGPLSLEVQALRGRVADLEQRVAFEVGEKEALAARLAGAEAALASCRPEAEALGRRAADLEGRLRRCEELEGGSRADLDLCRRGRAAAEEQRDALRSAAEVQAGERRAEAEGFRRELEDCRGRLAGAEAQAALMAAESRKRDLEASEKVEEVTCNYDRLLADVKAAGEALRKRVAELEEESASREAALDASREEVRQVRERLGLLEAEAASAAEEAARRRGERDRLRKDFEEALGPRTTFVLLDDALGVAAEAPLESLFATGSTELRPAARDLLRRVATILRQADVAGRVTVRAPLAVPRDLRKRYSSPWELASALAARVARALEAEGDVSAERLTAEARRLGATEGARASVLIELTAAGPARAGQPAPSEDPGEE